MKNMGSAIKKVVKGVGSALGLTESEQAKKARDEARRQAEAQKKAIEDAEKARKAQEKFSEDIEKEQAEIEGQQTQTTKKPEFNFADITLDDEEEDPLKKLFKI